MDYYIVCVPIIGDLRSASWSPGYVGRMYVRSNPPPLLAAYHTTSRLKAARIVREAVASLPVGDWPVGPAAAKDFQPGQGDVLVSVVVSLTDRTAAGSRVSVSHFPERRPFGDIPEIDPVHLTNTRRLSGVMGLQLISQMF